MPKSLFLIGFCVLMYFPAILMPFSGWENGMWLTLLLQAGVVGIIVEWWHGRVSSKWLFGAIAWLAISAVDQIVGPLVVARVKHESIRLNAMTVAFDPERQSVALEGDETRAAALWLVRDFRLPVAYQFDHSTGRHQATRCAPPPCSSRGSKLVTEPEEPQLPVVRIKVRRAMNIFFFFNSILFKITITEPSGKTTYLIWGYGRPRTWYPVPRINCLVSGQCDVFPMGSVTYFNRPNPGRNMFEFIGEALGLDTSGRR
ncbi:MAG: hypothetical protein AB7E70_19830 [Hyphomicrobiaceae bacterium]|uniref:hypothetical protein n=1 Tax=Bradyrhizobium sp. TaxID=376 RepID=UPI003D0BFECB